MSDAQGMGEKRSLETEIKLTFTDAVNGAQSLASHLEAMSKAMDNLEGGLNLDGLVNDIQKMVKVLESGRGGIKYADFKKKLIEQVNEALISNSIKFNDEFKNSPFKLTIPKEKFDKINDYLKDKLASAFTAKNLNIDKMKLDIKLNTGQLRNVTNAFKSAISKSLADGADVSIEFERQGLDKQGKMVMKKVPLKLHFTPDHYKEVLKSVQDQIINILQAPDLVELKDLNPGTFKLSAGKVAKVISHLEKQIAEVNSFLASEGMDKLPDLKVDLTLFREVVGQVYSEVGQVANALNTLDLQQGDTKKKVSELDKMIRTLRDTVTGRIGKLIKDITTNISIKKGDEAYNNYAEWLKGASHMINNFIKDSIDTSLAHLYKDLGYQQVMVDGKPIWQKGATEIGARIESATIEAVRQVAAELTGNSFLTSEDAQHIASELGIQTDITRKMIEANTKMFAVQLSRDVINVQETIFKDINKSIADIVKQFSGDAKKGKKQTKPLVDTTALMNKLNEFGGASADLPEERLDELTKGIKGYLVTRISTLVNELDSSGKKKLESGDLEAIDKLMYEQSKKLVDFSVKKSSDIIKVFTEGISDKNFKSFNAAEKKIIQDGMKIALKDAVSHMTRTVQTAFTSLAVSAEATRELEKDVEEAVNKAISEAGVTETGLVELNLTDPINKAIARAGSRIESVLNAWMPSEEGTIDVDYKAHVLMPLEGHIKRLLENISSDINALIETVSRSGVVKDAEMKPLKTAVNGYLNRYVAHLADSINELDVAQSNGRLNLNSVMGGLRTGANNFLTRYTDQLIEDADKVASELGGSFKQHTANLPQNVRRILATRGGYRTLREYQRAVPTQDGEAALREILDASLESTMEHMNDRFTQALNTHLKGIRDAIDGSEINFNPIHGDSLLQSITGNMNRVMEEVVAKLKRELDIQFREIFKGIRGLDITKQSLGYEVPARSYVARSGGRKAAVNPEATYDGQYGEAGFLFADHMPPAIRGTSKLGRDFEYEDALTRSAMITAERTKNRFRGSNLPEAEMNQLNDYLDNTYMTRMRSLAERAKSPEDYRIVAPLIKQLNQELQYLVEQLREHKRVGGITHRGGEMEKNLAEFMQRSQLKVEGIRTKFYGKLDNDDLDHMDATIDDIMSKIKSLASTEIVDVESIATAGRLMKQFGMELDTVNKYYDRINKSSDFDFKKDRLGSKLANLVAGGTMVSPHMLAEAQSKIMGARSNRELQEARDFYNDNVYAEHRANEGMLNDAYRENKRKDAKAQSDQEKWDRMVNRAYRMNDVFDERKRRKNDVMLNQAYRMNDQFDASKDRETERWKRMVNRAYTMNDQFDARKLRKEESQRLAAERAAERERIKDENIADRAFYANSKDIIRHDSFTNVALQKVRNRYADKLGEEDLKTLNMELDKLADKSHTLSNTPMTNDKEIKNRILEVADLINELRKLEVEYGQVSKAFVAEQKAEQKALKEQQSIGFNYTPNSVDDYRAPAPVKGKGGKSVTDAMMNSLRYMAAGSVLGMPSMMFYQGYGAYKEFEDQLNMAQANFQFKDPTMTQTAAKRIEAMKANGDITQAQYDDSATYKQLLASQQADLQNKASGGYSDALQHMAFANGTSLTDAGEAFNISSRRLADPNEALSLTRDILKTKSIFGDASTEEIAKGYEALASQWGLGVSDMPHASDMLIKAAGTSQAKVTDMLGIMERAGAVFRQAQPNATVEDKNKALANAIAMSSFFIQATARSGREGGTFYKGFLENIYNPESVFDLQKLSDLPQLKSLGINLNPYEETPNGGRKPKDAFDIFGQIMDLDGQVGLSAQKDVLRKVLARGQAGGEAAIEAYMGDLREELSTEKDALEKLNKERIDSGQAPIKGSGKDGAITAGDALKVRAGQLNDVTEEDIFRIQATRMGTYKFKSQQVATMFESATADVFKNLEGSFGQLATYLNSFLRTVKNNADLVSVGLQDLVHVGAALGLRYLWGKGMAKAKDSRFNGQANRIDSLRAQFNTQGDSINVRRRAIENVLNDAFSRGGQGEVDRMSESLKPEMAQVAAEATMLNERIKLLDNEVKSLGISEDKLKVQTRMVSTEFKNAKLDALTFDNALKDLAHQAGVESGTFDKLRTEVTELNHDFSTGTIKAKEYHRALADIGKRMDMASAGIPGVGGVTGGMGLVQMLAATTAHKDAHGNVIGFGASPAAFIGGNRSAKQRMQDVWDVFTQTRNLQGVLTAAGGAGAVLRDSEGKIVMDENGNPKFELGHANSLGANLTKSERLKGFLADKGLGALKSVGRAGLWMAAADMAGGVMNRAARTGLSDAEKLESDANGAMTFANQKNLIEHSGDGIGSFFTGLLATAGKDLGMVQSKLNGDNSYELYSKAKSEVEAEAKANGKSLSADELVRGIKTKLTMDAKEARFQEAKDLYEQDKSQMWLTDKKGNIDLGHVRDANITTLSDAQQIMQRIGQTYQPQLDKGQSDYNIESSKNLIQGFNQNSAVAIKASKNFLEAQNKLLTAYAAEIGKKMSDAEKAGQKDSDAYKAYEAQKAQLDAQAAQNDLTIHTNDISQNDYALQVMGQNFDFQGQKTSNKYQMQLDNLLLQGYSPDSESAKAVQRTALTARNQEISNEIPQLQSMLSKYDPNKDETREKYQQLWLHIEQLQVEQRDNLVKIRDSLTKFATFNLPDGIQPMTYFDAMSSASQFKNVTTRVGDVVVNVTLGSDMTADDANKIGQAIAGHVQRGQEQQAQALGNQVKAGFQGNYNSMIGGK